MDSYIRYMKNLLAVIAFALTMLARSIILLPVHVLRWIGEHSILVLAVTDIILVAALVWMLKVTRWSFWGHW